MRPRRRLARVARPIKPADFASRELMLFYKLYTTALERPNSNAMNTVSLESGTVGQKKRLLSCDRSLMEDG